MRPLLPALVLLAACTAQPPGPTGDAVPASPALPPVAHITPDVSDADYDSPVAPYVLARGAGPSRLSPDGRWIATRLSLTGTRQLYVMDARAADPKATLRMISNGSGITQFEFSPDGSLLYAADNNGDERETYWVADWTGEGWDAPRRLLPAAGNGFRVFGGFSGDGSRLVYSSTEAGGEDFDIYVAEVATGEARRVHEGRGGLYAEAVSPDGRRAVLAEAVGEDANRLVLLDLDTGDTRVLSDPEPRADHTEAGVHFLSDDRLVFATNADKTFATLRVEDLGAVRIGSDLMAEGDADVDAVVPCGEGLAWTLNRDGFSAAFRMDGARRIAAVPGLPRGVHTIDCADDGTLLVRVSAPDVPGDLYLAAPGETPRRVFASDYEGLDPDRLVVPESLRLRARDGVVVQGLLSLPPVAPPPAPRPPVVFMVHGGPTAQARPTYNSTVQYLLSRGIAVFQTNVRGSTGFGRTYTTLDDRERRLDSVRDLVDMLEHLEADGRVDTSRAAVMGGSYGGYMVNAVLADYPDAFDAGIALFGVGDWVTALEVASPQLKASDVIEYGNIDEPRWREFYARISPVAKADAIRVPVLYSHGAMDPRIDKAETEVMVRALRANGVRADYILFPDEGHGWRKLRNRLYYERVQAEFLEDVFGP